ncbi:MAG: lipase maturation factor family protein [Verrucomicrobiota bacterium]
MSLVSLFTINPGSHRIARFCVIRGFGLIYLVAILSWWVQAPLLVGEAGLTPFSQTLSYLEGYAAEENGPGAWSLLPNIFLLLGTGDAVLHIICAIGCLLAVVVILGRVTAPALILLWAIYLSLVNTGGVFMSFQWDILVLEAGVIAPFLARWSWRDDWRCPAPLGLVAKIALLFVWLLIAKLMFFSGWTKLAFASPEQGEWWPERTAMTFHYFTQPLPTWTAYWAHHLPDGFHRFSIWPMFLIELIFPFLILFGRWGRFVAAIGFVTLMLLILATGNYTYFNWLTIILSLSLIDDRCWPGRLRRWLGQTEKTSTPNRNRVALTWCWARRLAAASFALLLLILNFHRIGSDLHRAPRPVFTQSPNPESLDRLAANLSPWHLVAGYGLFRTMTTTRPELIFEGSTDGIRWSEYDFRWKVDRLKARPRFVAPHQPRLAWQCWFAALEGVYSPRSSNGRWISGLVEALLRGDETVKSLLEHDPFPEDPPRFIRIRLFEYTFTNPSEKERTGRWWRREVKRTFLPGVSIRR